ncbi:hypothetical protein K505DRAFT_372129 [Melanomma pulvis-pyrius CBS 109.77]|uniref:Rhodopsin domain-containing protein n=1 Tax=Melanomma pulvis-pyrius CBS 109.77 TaxID=1314802 RepID=A0A6A6XMX0_9PLEO|nr:hypothetical protein K505DRAFT_372129 [Melanomma pulvis-pyrius CBS 109.77]
MAHFPPAASVAIASIILNVVFVGLRVWARVLHSPRWQWADVLVPLSLVLNLVLATLILVFLLSVGMSYSHPTPASLKLSAFYIPMIYGIASAVPKLAVLDVYLGIFPARWARWTLLATGAIIICNALAYIPTTIWQCKPIRFSWDHSIPGGTCNDFRLHFSLASLPNILTDLVILGVPIPIIAKLHLDKAVKAGVLATFLSGGIGLIASIIRFAMFLQWTPATNRTEKIDISSLVETSFYLVAACLLSLRPLVKRVVGSVASYSGEHSRSRMNRKLGEGDSTGELVGGRGGEGKGNVELVKVVAGV